MRRLGFGIRGRYRSKPDTSTPTAPTDIFLAASSFAEDTALGPITVISANGNPASTFTIISDPDSLFSIVSGVLNLVAPFDYETKTSHTVTIQADNGVGVPQQKEFTITVTDVAEGTPSSSVMGFQADKDEGTDADLYVDNVNGDDSNDGTTVGTAFATANRALLFANSHDVISVRGLGGAYREQLDTHTIAGIKDNITFKAHGTEKPVFKGSVDLTGAVICTSGDESVVGANYASIYKVENVPKTNFVDDDPFNAALLEDDEFMTIAMGRQPNPRFRTIESYNLDWLEAENVNTTEVWNPNLNDGAGGWVTVIVSHQLDWLSNFTKEQIENCDIRFHRAPNGATRVPVQSYDEATRTVTLERNPSWHPWQQEYESNQYKDRFALVNLLPQMQKGEWGFFDNGDGTVNLYFWPSNVANVNTAMEYCIFDTIFNIRNAVTNLHSITVKNTSATQGVGSTTPVRMDGTNGSGDLGAITMDNCLLRNSMNKGDGYGLLYMRKHNGSVISQCTFENSRNAFGLFLTGGNYDSPDGQTRDVTFRNNIIQFADKSPLRVYANENMVISDVWLLYSGLAAHANTGNVYEGGHKVIWIRVLA